MTVESTPVDTDPLLMAAQAVAFQSMRADSRVWHEALDTAVEKAVTLVRDALRATPEPPLRFANECHEEVTRRGEWEPCDLPAVALRIDEGEPYPVCGFHSRPPMVPLAQVLAGARPVPAAPTGPRSEKIGGYSGGKTVRAAGSTPTPKETDD